MSTPAYVWDFSAVSRNAGLLADGLGNTLALSGAGIALGVALGGIVAALRLSPSPLLRLPARAFIAFYRNTPPLVHFFWFFYGLPIAFGWALSPFAAALLALGIQSSAFFAEVIRAGLAAVERGQWEAGRALGMSRLRLLRRIVGPQALQAMTLPFLERCFELVKTTTLAAALAFHDVIYNAMVVTSATYRPLEVYSAVAVLFFLVLFTVSRVVGSIDLHFRRRFG